MEIRHFGLLGRHIGYSLSPLIFKKIFAAEQVPYTYQIFDVPVTDGHELNHFGRRRGLAGFNVTIPYKSEFRRFADMVGHEAVIHTGTANCISYDPLRDKYVAYNTDVFGFEWQLSRFFHVFPERALVLGAGATSRTVRYVLEKNKVQVTVVNRTPRPEEGVLPYEALDTEMMAGHLLVVNTTPLGGPQYPDLAPPIPYEALSPAHVLIDVNYRPRITGFMREGRRHRAYVMNGLPMLVAQAWYSWLIWKADLAKYGRLK